MHIPYELVPHVPSSPTFARNRRKTNWECYSTDLQATLHATTMVIRDADTLEKAADQLLSAIITAYEHNCLPSKIKKARKTHWWNRKLEKLRKETRKGFKKRQERKYGRTMEPIQCN